MRVPSLDDLDIDFYRVPRDRYTVANLLRDLKRHRSARLIVWTGQSAVEVTPDFVVGLLVERRMLRRYRWQSPYRLSVPRTGFAVLRHQPYRKRHH